MSGTRRLRAYFSVQGVRWRPSLGVAWWQWKWKWGPTRASALKTRRVRYRAGHVIAVPAAIVPGRESATRGLALASCEGLQPFNVHMHDRFRPRHTLSEHRHAFRAGACTQYHGVRTLRVMDSPSHQLRVLLPPGLGCGLHVQPRRPYMGAPTTRRRKDALSQASENRVGY